MEISSKMEILKGNLIKGSVVNKGSLVKLYIYKNIITQSLPPQSGKMIDLIT